MEKLPKIKTPEEAKDSFGELVNEARYALIQTFLEYSWVVDSAEGRKLVDEFVHDLLARAGVNEHATFHELDLDAQRKALKEDPFLFFGKHITDELLQSYRDKIKALIK